MKKYLRTQLLNLGIGTRIVLIFTLVFTGMGGLSLVLLHNSLLPTFERMESKHALDSAWRVVKAFDHQMTTPAELSSDWALWDDMYSHAQKPDPEFARSNYSDEVVAGASYHAVLILNRKHEVVGYGSQPMSNGLRTSSQDFALPLAEHLKHSPLAEGQTKCGLARMRNALSAICWTGIMMSDRRGPMMGTVGMAVELDAEALASMKRSVGATFSIELVGAQPTPAPAGFSHKLPDFEHLSNTELVQHFSDSSIVSHYLLHDLNDKPVAWLNIHMDRQLIQQGRKVIQGLFIQLAALALVTGLVLILTVQWWLVRPVARLRRSVASIASTKRWDKELNVDRHDEIGELTQGINSLLAVLSSQVDTLREISSTDALTGISNRRHFDTSLGAELARLGRRTSCLSLLLIDVDHFKLYNDRYGHPQGDEVLRQLGSILGASCRQQDLPARVGGEEFALILPDTDVEGAQAVANKIIKELAALALEHAAAPTAPVVTMSIGTTTWLGVQDGGTEAFYAQADKALYSAKQLGRNRVCAYESPCVPSL